MGKAYRWAEESGAVRRGAHSDSWWQHLNAKEINLRENGGAQRRAERMFGHSEIRMLRGFGLSDVQTYES